MGALGQGPGGEVSDARGDIPRERYYYPGSVDPIRGNSAYTPANGYASGATPQVPVVGLVILAVIVLAFEHFRKGR